MMRFLIQRVKKASVTVENDTVGKIETGFLVLIGIRDHDSTVIADRMIHKMMGLRIFEDHNGKTNLNLESVNGSVLLISQFTLYANCRHGNRPSFLDAGDPSHAEDLYRYIATQCKSLGLSVQDGIFGANMQVELVNDGPFTILLDSSDLGYDNLS